jgi:hypothetical protein
VSPGRGSSLSKGAGSGRRPSLFCLAGQDRGYRACGRQSSAERGLPRVSGQECAVLLRVLGRHFVVPRPVSDLGLVTK